jgi:hypothetical protein
MVQLDARVLRPEFELAGELKVEKKMSLVDCFAAALAKREKAEIYTGDPEFKTVERESKSFGYRSFATLNNYAICSHDPSNPRPLLIRPARSP